MRPNYPEAHLGLGLVYLLSAQPENAAKQRELLTKLDPAMAEALDKLIKEYSSSQ
jgi:hypothetical protein